MPLPRIDSFLSKYLDFKLFVADLSLAYSLIPINVNYIKPMATAQSVDEYYEPYLSIGTAARMLGISVFTLRMYEREGIFIPYKADSNQRRYSQSDIDRLKCIRRAINESKMSIEGIKRVQALIPCWQIVGCSEADRAKCEAYKSPKAGCWTYQHTNNICATHDCRLCEVYRTATDCTQIKEIIIQVTNKSANETKQ